MQIKCHLSSMCILLDWYCRSHYYYFLVSEHALLEAFTENKQKLNQFTSTPKLVYSLLNKSCGELGSVESLASTSHPFSTCQTAIVHKMKSDWKTTKEWKSGSLIHHWLQTVKPWHHFLCQQACRSSKDQTIFPSC